MPYIRVIPIEEAGGLLKRLYDNAIRRAGKIWNIVSIMSVNPRAMQASIDGMYGTLMFGEFGPEPRPARDDRRGRLGDQPLSLLKSRPMRTTSVPRSTIQRWPTRWPPIIARRHSRRPTALCLSSPSD